MSGSLTSSGAQLSAVVLAVALIPAAVWGQAAHPAGGQVVWHWFGGCATTDSLILDFHVDGKAVYSSVFPICKVRRADIKPEFQQRLLTFRFEAAPRRFGAQYRAAEPESIGCNIWEAGQQPNAVVLRVSFATAERVLLNTRHLARADTPARSEWIRGLVLTTRRISVPSKGARSP
jgi:hypothetical protein